MDCPDEIKRGLEALCRKAKDASAILANSSAETKNRWLSAMADALEAQSDSLIEENRKDMIRSKAAGLSDAKLDRLALNEKRIKDIADALRHVTTLPDPVGRVLSEQVRPNGIRIEKVSVPIGVIGIIYEARPNVTVDAAGLCLKAGNAVVLRGGSESICSNIALAKCISDAGQRIGMPEGAVQLLPWTDHAAVQQMIRMDSYLNLIIPRGGERLIRTVVENATIPVIKHYKGVCHVFVDAEADIDMALNIIENGKCQRPSVCNAVETVLIDRAIAPRFAPLLAERLLARQVELRGDDAFRSLCSAYPVRPVEEQDWSTEYMDLILSLRIVDGVREAVAHINRYGSGHSDCIVTKNSENAEYFLNYTDSAACYVNASTRFTDGGEFGMGAEIGISTDKLHARGPMGLPELTIYKYKIRGNGQIR